MSTEKLFNRNFLLMVIGQIISIFGNSILRFALPLYILKVTGSATIFGSILAIAMIPTIILSPFGGLVADRVNRRNIMVALDFITAAAIGSFWFALSLPNINTVIIIVVVLILLSIIQSFYQPAVQASVPLLSSKDNLMKANAVVNQVNALANLLGPVIGGVLYGFYGLIPIVIISGISFFLSAVMEIFIHLPFERLKSETSILATIKNDFRGSTVFITKEKPIILKTTFVIAAFNLFFYSMMLIGVPYIITIILGLSSELLGVAQGFMAAGALMGGILVGVFSSKIKIQKSYKLFLLTIIMMLPIGLTLMLNLQPIISYIVITVCGLGFMALCTIFSITMLSFVQKETPNQIIGKVIAYVLTLCMVSQPVGQAMYGFLFTAFKNSVYIVVFLSAILNIIIMLASKKMFAQIVD